MKQLQNLEGAFLHNLRRTLYATMIIVLAVSIPVLSWVGLSHNEGQSQKSSEITTTKLTTKSTAVLFQKQS